MTLAVAEYLPDIELPSADGVPVRLRPPAGRTTVLVALHSSRCAGCREYLDRLSPIADEFEAWDARLLAVAPDRPAEAAPIPIGRILCDERRRITNGESAFVVVADRYSQVFYSASAGASHDLPSPRELAEWLKFLGTLCPE